MDDVYDVSLRLMTQVIDLQMVTMTTSFNICYKIRYLPYNADHKMGWALLTSVVNINRLK